MTAPLPVGRVSNPSYPDLTYAACLTPPGTGAIATLAIRGPRSWSLVRELFSPGRKPGRQLPAEPEPGKLWLGRLGPDPRGSLADEVVLAVKRTVPVPWIELHCHGGREVIRYLLEVIEARDVRVCSWQELERLTGGDPAAAAALAALAEARTVRTAGILLDQYHGAFARAVATAQAALAAGQHADAAKLLLDLARYASLGRHLTSPWRVVIAGAPNVGKSSLVNALAGYQRSVVAPTPGTTRDVVTTVMAIDGWPVELADTAGLRQGAELLEQMGMDRARTAVAQADLCLWVLDISAAPIWPPLTPQSLHYAINKLDLPPAMDFIPPEALYVSARTGYGMADLCQALAGWLVPDVPSPGAAVPFTPYLCDRVEEASRHCSAGQFAEARQALEAIWDVPAKG